MFKNISFTINIILFALFWHANLYAKDTVSDIDSLAYKQISEVTVTGLLNNKLNLPYVEMDGEEALDDGKITTADLLDGLPGISIERDGRWATTVNIRGFDESKLLFLSDGDRMMTASDVAGALSTFDLGNVERVEVIKGAGSVIHGTGAMGGVVNIVSRRPQYTQNLSTEGRIASGFHTVNKLWENNLNVDITNRDWYLALDGSYRTAQNTITPFGVQPNSQFNDASWGVRGGIRNGENQELLINYNHFEAWDVGLPGGSAFPKTATVRYKAFKRNQLSGEYIFRDLTDIVKSFNIKAYTQNIRREVENQVNEKLAIYPNSLNMTAGAKATADLYFNDYETMTVGLDGWYRDQQTSRFRFNVDAANDTLLTKELPTPKANVLDLGVFAQHKWVIDPKYWTMSTGVRLDYIRTVNDTAFSEIAKYKYVNGIKEDVPYDDTPRFFDGEKNEFAYAAHIDFAYKPHESHQLVLSLANAYRVASLEERFKYIDQSGTPMVGNPDLKPEKGLFSNLAYALTKNKFSLNVDLYANYIFDLIGVQEGPYKAVDGTDINALVNTNIDRAMLLGGELDFRWLISSTVELEGNLAYVHGVDIVTQEELPMLPPLHGELKVHYNVFDKVNTYLAAIWDLDFIDIDEDNEDVSHSFLVFEAGFHSTDINLGAIKLQLVGGVQNIFDTPYVEHLAAERGINLSEPGRNFFVRAKFKW